MNVNDKDGHKMTIPKINNSRDDGGNSYEEPKTEEPKTENPKPNSNRMIY